MSYCTVVGTGIVRVLRWVVCCVFEGFLEVIVRAADHGDTLLTGYPAAGYPTRKSRRVLGRTRTCLLYTSPSPRDLSTSRMPSSA